MLLGNIINQWTDHMTSPELGLLKLSINTLSWLALITIIMASCGGFGGRADVKITAISHSIHVTCIHLHWIRAAVIVVEKSIMAPYLSLCRIHH